MHLSLKALHLNYIFGGCQKETGMSLTKGMLKIFSIRVGMEAEFIKTVVAETRVFTWQQLQVQNGEHISISMLCADASCFVYSIVPQQDST